LGRSSGCRETGVGAGAGSGFGFGSGSGAGAGAGAGFGSEGTRRDRVRHAGRAHTACRRGGGVDVGEPIGMAPSCRLRLGRA
jgi:hypothetical protein